MKKKAREAALQRVREIAHRVRSLIAYDGHSSPPDWRPAVAELADELALVIEALS